jgi:hypothetical protein
MTARKDEHQSSNESKIWRDVAAVDRLTSAIPTVI